MRVAPLYDLCSPYYEGWMALSRTFKRSPGYGDSRYLIQTDQQLVTLAQSGDAAAFEMLFNRYRDGIRNSTCPHGGNGNDADDLLQETFIKEFLNLDKYDTAFTIGSGSTRSPATPSSTLSAAGVTISSSTPPRPAPLRPQLRLAGGNPRGAVHRPAARRPAGAAPGQDVAPLPAADRAAFLLRILLRRDRRRTGHAAGTVKTQIHRARAQLCALITASDML